jgi:regulator of RNase E activity RraA
VKLHTVEADLFVTPGDYLIADLNGVVLVPKSLAQDVLPLMAKQVAADAKVAEAIQGKMTFTEASRKFRV